MRLAILLFGTLIVLGGVPVTSGPGPSAAAVAAEVTDLTPREQRALSFRRTFGLDTDLAAIREAEGPHGYEDRGYGVALSKAEVDEMWRRIQIEHASYAAVDFGREQAGWAGYYIDQLALGAPVFLFTSNLEDARAHIARLLPPDTGFRVEKVDRTLEELERSMAAIQESRAELRSTGIHITSSAIDLVRNDVVVGIEGLTDGAAQEIAAQFGTFVRTEEMGPAYADIVACPDYGCRQIKGGIRIVGPAGINYMCTAGWIVRRGIDDSLGVLTAGHCLWAQGTADPWGDDFGHGNGSNVIVDFGDARHYSFADNVYGDVGLIEIRTGETVYDNSPNRMWDNAYGVRYVNSYVDNVYQTAGSQACAFGAASNDMLCDVILVADAMRESVVDPPGPGAVVSNTIQHTKVYGLDLIHGDSGGPIFQRPNPYSTNVSVLGTHVHSAIEGNTSVDRDSTGWYTPYFWGKSAYAIASQANGAPDYYNVCTTGTC